MSPQVPLQVKTDHAETFTTPASRSVTTNSINEDCPPSSQPSSNNSTNESLSSSLAQRIPSHHQLKEQENSEDQKISRKNCMDPVDAIEFNQKIAEYHSKNHTAISTSASLDDSKYVLGFGFINIIGLGPTIKPYQTSRKIKNKQVSRIVQIAGPKMSGLQRESLEHCLVIGVDKDALNLSTLTPDVTQSFQIIKALDGGADFEVILYSGQHRRAALQQLLKKDLKKLDKVQEERRKSQDEDSDLSATERKIFDHCYTYGLWLAKVYDIDALSKSPLQAAIITKITSNNMLKALSDNPKEHLSANIINLINCSTEQGRVEVIRQCLQEEKTHGNEDVQFVLAKHPPIVDFLIRVHNMESFVNFFAPKNLVESRKVVWGFIEPILIGNWKQLVYLCSNADFPDGQVLALDIHDYAIGLEEEALHSFSSDVASYLVALSEEAFQTHLDPVSSLWALGSDTYQAAQKLYWDSILAGVRALQDRCQWTEEQVEILEGLPRKLSLVENHRPFHGYEGIPVGLEECMVLCPSYCQMILKTFCNMSTDIELLLTYLVPGTSFFTKQRQGKKQKQQDADIFGDYISTSEVLKEYLIYFSHSNHSDWATSSPNELLNLIPGARKDLSVVWHEIITTILCHRAEAFHYPEGTSIAELEKQHNNMTLKKSCDKEAKSQQLVEYLLGWISYNLTLEKQRLEVSTLLKSKQRLRVHQQPPSPSVVPPLAEPSSSPFLIQLVTKLSQTHINWHSTQKTDTTAHRIRVTKAIAIDMKLWEAYRKSFVEAQAGFRCLLKEIIGSLQESPNWQDWSSWLGVEDLGEKDRVRGNRSQVVGTKAKTRMGSQKNQDQKAKINQLLETFCAGLGDVDLDELDPALMYPMHRLMTACHEVQEVLSDTAGVESFAPSVGSSKRNDRRSKGREGSAVADRNGKDDIACIGMKRKETHEEREPKGKEAVIDREGDTHVDKKLKNI
ncbi:hypothetical protein FB446DRAFT_87210 [Lentinula raphanica]|nr:hypothetical protein FB446DRAFT_87210 [Lentinula raphanica]